MLKTAGLQFSYPPHFCLRFISINLPAGARMLLKGPNGSGKSTLLRLLGGLLTPDSGSLELSAKKTAFAGHNPAVYPYLSVRENLEFWLCLQKKPESPRIPGKYSAEDALALMGLEDVSREKAASLSRGMLQRLDLARIISLNAGLVLLDEPENSLEAKYLDIFRREIAARTDAAAIWASHVLDADFKLPGAPLFTHALTLQEIKPGVFSGRVEQVLGEASC